MSKSMYYCRFTGDYARDTSHLNLVQHGAYTVLLDFYYSSGKPLPPDLNALCRICRAFDDPERDAVSQILSEFFELRTDGYHNKRADREIAYRTKQYERQSRAAQETNKKRWGSPSHGESPSNTLTESLSDRIPSPSPSPHPHPHKDPKSIPSAEPAEITRPSEFDVFWGAFPRKLDKQSARRAWVKNFCEGHLGEILASLEAWKATSQWADPKFIPYPATWLNKGRHKETPAREEKGSGHTGAIKPAAGKYDRLSVVRAIG